MRMLLCGCSILILAACSSKSPAPSHALAAGSACQEDTDCDPGNSCQGGVCAAISCASVAGSCIGSDPTACSGVATALGYSDCGGGNFCCLQPGQAACGAAASGAQCVTTGSCSNGYVIDTDTLCGTGNDCCGVFDDCVDDGTCVSCPDGQEPCDGSCSDPTSDSNNCGGCGNVCGDGTTCCNGNCTDPTLDPGNCGACGTVCPAADFCCGGGCTDPTSDPNNCGGCGTACSAGSSCCSSVCSDPTSDPTNCGACGNACAGGDNCCSSSCSDPTSDSNNCGSCGNACATGTTCSSSSCM